MMVLNGGFLDDIGSVCEKAWKLIPAWYRNALSEEPYGTVFFTFLAICLVVAVFTGQFKAAGGIIIMALFVVLFLVFMSFISGGC